METLVGVGDRRFDTPQARRTVEKAAAMKAEPKPAGKPGPTDAGGTFSSMAPRSAAVGGRVAVPFAVLTTTGSTMWQATVEGYRQAWPEIRAEQRRKMVERAARREAERVAAKEAGAAGLVRAPAVAVVYPPMPERPPTVGTTPPAPAGPAVTTPGAAKAAVKPPLPQRTVPAARPEPAVAAADDQSIAAVIDEASTLVNGTRTAAPSLLEDRLRHPSRTGDGSKPPTTEPTTTAPTPTPTPTATGTAVRPKAAPVPSNVVPFPTPSGDPMASPFTAIPEIRTLDGLINALTMTRAMCEMRAEEAEAIAADDLALSNRLDALEAELDALEVDDGTRAEIAGLREAVHTQSTAAASYGGNAKDSADLAMAVAAAAHKSHGGIAEAVQSSPIPVAAQAGYYEH